MSRLTLWALCLVVPCFVGCTPSETPTGIDPEVPEAASPDKKSESLPDTGDYQVLLETTKGNIIMDVHPEWSPRGAQRFKELVELGFYDNCAFFRVIDGFMAQIGINGDPKLHAKWRDNNLMDDPVVESNKRGYVSFAKTGAPNSRSTQFFINFGDNSRLDGMGFSPFAQVIEGMDVVDSLYNGYGEGARAPDQGKLVDGGNVYLKKEFPMLDYIKKAVIISDRTKVEAKPEATDSAKPAAKEDKKPVEPAAEKKAEAKPEKAAATKEQ